MPIKDKTKAGQPVEAPKGSHEREYLAANQCGSCSDKTACAIPTSEAQQSARWKWNDNGFPVCISRQDAGFRLEA